MTKWEASLNHTNNILRPGLLSSQFICNYYLIISIKSKLYLFLFFGTSEWAHFLKTKAINVFLYFCVVNVMRMEMVNMLKRQQPHQDEQCQLKATHGSSMNDEVTLTPQGKLYLFFIWNKVLLQFSHLAVQQFIWKKNLPQFELMTYLVSCTTKMMNHLPDSPQTLWAVISKKTSPYSSTVRNLFHRSTGTDYKQL